MIKVVRLKFIALLMLSFWRCTHHEKEQGESNSFLIHPSTLSNLKIKVVELFTSESCSDCPAGELAFKQADSVLNDAICIAEHIDYWNGLNWGEKECNGNWIDKYSTGENSIRQYNYSQFLKTIQCTPQVIINGKLAIPDAKSDSIVQAVNYLQSNPSYVLKLISQDQEVKDKIKLQFECVGIDSILDKNTDSLKPILMLHFFLTERNLNSIPDKGENCGKSLEGYKVMRAGKTISLRNYKIGTTEIDVPDGVKLENCELVGFVQNLRNYKILAINHGFVFKKK